MAGTGASFILGRTGPDALSLLEAGRRSSAIAAQQEANRQAKRVEQDAKDYHDSVKYEQSGSPYFAQQLNEKVYKPFVGELRGIYEKRDLDRMGRQMAAEPLKQRVGNETKQSDAKTAYLNDAIRKYQNDPLYNAKYATEHLAKALRGKDGSGLLPSEFDEEAWKAGLLGDHQLYNEKAVIDHTTKGLFPIISQKIAEAGQLGGQHTADTVRGRLVAFDGKGHPMLNADGSPKLNLTADMDNLLDSDPLFKLKTDARVAAYDAERQKSIEANAADPTVPVLPIMTRRGHHAQMVGPLAFYDTTKDEGLNALVPRNRAAAKDNPNKVVVSDYAGARQSDYVHPMRGQVTNHYAEVGQSFGSAAKPYVEVSVPTANMTIIGQDGKPTDTNHIKGGGNTKVKAQTRSYVLYTKSGKRLGRPEAFATDQEAADYALKIAREYPKPQDLELRVEGRGIVEDAARTAGDGLGGLGGAPLVYQPAKNRGETGKMAPDNSVAKTERTVLFPITQEADEQLARATGGKWSHYKPSPAQAALLREVTKRGGKFVSPYSHAQREAEKATNPKTKPQRPAFLNAPTTGQKAKKVTNNKTTNAAAGNSGGML
ncbi:hypothetical protein [Hymenobacter convexus]|uniref:hypothetical protein n=1 Tax=Hymenobacter sp. CA1UV-4 TaxID=3063782 RepID=UPI0027140CD5|nr:hypothetical protein [Hymenobacter sp. CA1UV-4]MDO7852953.1 hypothetical protein [Hymenobacter sp. CA1UV-4]